MVEERTYNKVWKFIQEKKLTYFSEIVRLGTTKNRIDQNSLNQIIDKLLLEKKIRIIKIGKMIGIKVTE